MDKKWELVWSDEFDGSILDDSIWNYEIGYIRNNELQYYANRTENVRLENGKLIIEARKEQVYDGHDYTSASINTKGKKSWKYGKLEIRAKLPYGQGIWPAFWTKGVNEGWPKCGEIDIMEMIGGVGDNESYGTIHYYNNGHDKVGGMYTMPGGNFCDDFHIFGIEWSEDSILWYIDDDCFYETRFTEVNKSQFNREHFILLNLAVGGDWPGAPDKDTVFPQQYIIDWVRVYQ